MKIFSSVQTMVIMSVSEILQFSNAVSLSKVWLGDTNDDKANCACTMIIKKYGK